MEKVMEPKEKFHIEILVVLRDVQQQHGLRHKDYHSYHQYVSRKLHRMRKSLNFPQGKGNRVIPKKMTKSLVTESRFLLVKLFEAERGWACAMQLKAEGNTEPRKLYHMRQRMTRAVRRARDLWEMCKWDKCAEHPGAEQCEICAICDAHTYLETQAYYYAMEGLRFFELGDWINAKSMYERSLRDYAGLANAVEKDHEQIYLGKSEEIRTLIRYCVNNEKDVKAGGTDLGSLHVTGTDLDHFDDLLKQIYKNQVAVMTEVNWLGIIIPVKNNNVRLEILALMDANKELCTASLDNTAKIDIYDSMLKRCTNALNLVRDDLKLANMTVQINNQPLDNMSRLQVLFVYLQYVKLTKTVERNLLIVETNIDCSQNKPQNIARLYDTVMQNLQEMSSLPGLNRESTDSNGQLEIQTKISVYTAHRCYYLSQAHLLMKRFSECAALLARTVKHCDSALLSLKMITSSSTGTAKSDDQSTGVAINDRLIPGPVPDDLVAKIRALIETVEADQLICRANRCLSLIDDATVDVSPTSINIDMPLWRRLDEYCEDVNLSKKQSSAVGAGVGRLIQSPPEFEPIPVKPVFFDLAYYHVTYPSLDDKVSDKRSRDNQGGDQGKVGGIAGMVTSWFRGSK